MNDDKYECVVSQLAVGEFKNKIFKSCDNVNEKCKYTNSFTDLLHNINADLKPLKYEDIEIARQIKDKIEDGDDRNNLDPTDTFLLSQGVNGCKDKNISSVHFLTTDKKIIENDKLISYVRKISKENNEARKSLIIFDDIFKLCSKLCK